MQRLGQHFLLDKKTQQKIIRALELKSNDVLFEIGPGHGELTEELIKNFPGKIIAVEKDKKLFESLREKFVKERRIQIIEGDIRKILPLLPKKLKTLNPASPAGRYKLTGNIPYYLTGFLLRLISELSSKPELSVFTIQKEVGDRLVAQPPHYNKLAASVAYWAKTEIVSYVSKKLFNPSPKVDSVIIKLVTQNFAQEVANISAENYYSLVKIIFAQPRKTILNNLLSGTSRSRAEILEILSKVNLRPDLRPQNLEHKDLLSLAKAIF